MASGCQANIIIIISGFGIYGAAVVTDSGVGNTWQRLTTATKTDIVPRDRYWYHTAGWTRLDTADHAVA